MPKNTSENRISSPQNRLIKFLLRFMVPWWRAGLSLQQQRKNLNRLAGPSKWLPGINITPVSAGGLPCEWLDAGQAASNGVILYFHGGGYVIGSIKTHRDLAARISAAAGCRLLNVDYRLAPEHPFPAALEDAVQAYRWLLSSHWRSESIFVAGDSAGGGLALALLLQLRDLSLPAPAGGILLSPWTDLTLSGASHQFNRKSDIMLRHFDPEEKAALYAGEYDLKNPFISPLFADHTNLPPLLIQVGADEILRDDSTRLAERVAAAGGEVRLEVWENMIHVFQAQAAFLPEARQAIEHIGDFVRESQGKK